MSLMTQSLLLHAQSLRLDGQLDESIDLLRTVVSQCDAEDARRDGSDSEVNDDDGGCNAGDARADATRRLREVASYQLALLLLQRCGRQSDKTVCNFVASTAIEIDETDADAIMWQRGYRLRLSSRAFGYPHCSCDSGGNDQSSQSSSRIPLEVIDNALPPAAFDALRNAFRPDSRYWTELYSKINTEASVSPDVRRDSNSIERNAKTNQFASHNIPLPTLDSNATSLSFLNNLQQAKSLLEQVAIITQHRLKGRFPEIVEATSVEVWSHRRPPDGQHQLHYDLDEVLLWKRRKDREQTSGIRDGGNKRQKTESENGGNGISCPIVSCVLTINIPSREEACHRCGFRLNSAPTIVCNQSIMRQNDNRSNVGWLCYPWPNRLLAFEGSLLHGVVPGIPFATESDDESSGSSDYHGGPDFHAKQTKTPCGKKQRITLMMGFWKDVCLTVPDKAAATVMAPNVPFDSVAQKDSWTGEFNPMNVSESDVALVGNPHAVDKSKLHITVVDPLWIPIRNKAAASVDRTHDMKSTSGRFFLKSLQPTDIDNEVLSGK